MLKKLLALLVLALCFVSLNAQGTNNRILGGVDGTWYSWLPNETSLTELPLTAPTQDITFSPDRTKVAYRVENTELNPGMFPANLFLVDVATNQTTQLTPQDNFLIRSYPAFSPDSTQIAWVEYSEKGGTVDAYLMIYAIGSASASRLADWTLGFQDGGVYLETSQWTSIGIHNKYFTFVEYPQKAYRLQIINPKDGTSREVTLAEHNVNDSSDHPSPESIFIANFNSLVVVPYKPFLDIYTFDLTTSQKSFNPSVNQYVTEFGDFQIIYDRTLKETMYIYRDQPVKRVGGDTFAITPNGDGLLFTEFGKLYALNEGTPVAIARFPLKEITVVGAAITPSPLNPVSLDTSNAKIGTCTLQTRLSAGFFQMAQVIPGMGANVLREVPGLDGAEIAELYEYAEVTVGLESPRCADGYLWHNVGFDLYLGWTAEGDLDGTYWLKPTN